MLADELDAQGHSVAIIDVQSTAFQRLGSDYSGQRVHGSGFDQAVLKKAHITEAYAFAAVSNGNAVLPSSIMDASIGPPVSAQMRQLNEGRGVPVAHTAPDLDRT